MIQTAHCDDLLSATPAGPVDVSVVVCTYNRAEMLRDALVSLAELDCSGKCTFEIVVIDNASTDNTRNVVDDFATAAPVSVRYAYEAKPGVSAARNRGIREGRGEWIAFMDDDQIADPHWLTALLATAHGRNVRCVGGANRLKLPDGFEARDLAKPLRSLLGESVGRDSERPYTRKRAPGAGNLLIHRSVFEQVGTFDESLAAAGEDTDLYGRLWAQGIRAWCNPEAVSCHRVPAHRLDERYLRWKCQRNGGHLAHRVLSESGRLWAALLLVLRLVQAVGLHWPRLILARMRKDQETALGLRCLCWRATGYLRFALYYLAPRLFAQRTFMKRMEFRGNEKG